MSQSINECEHDYKDVGYGVVRCAKCQHQEIVDPELFRLSVLEYLGELKQDISKL